MPGPPFLLTVTRSGPCYAVQRLNGSLQHPDESRYLHLSDADLLAAIDRAFPES
jgi:hypothetical protein